MHRNGKTLILLATVGGVAGIVVWFLLPRNEVKNVQSNSDSNSMDDKPAINPNPENSNGNGSRRQPDIASIGNQRSDASNATA
jgi:hypothetical protein